MFALVASRRRLGPAIQQLASIYRGLIRRLQLLSTVLYVIFIDGCYRQRRVLSENEGQSRQTDNLTHSGWGGSRNYLSHKKWR